jgi:hypothetical protein
VLEKATILFIGNWSLAKYLPDGSILLKAFRENTENPYVNNEEVNENVNKANVDELLNPNQLNYAITSDYRAPDKPHNKIDLGKLTDKVLGGIKPSDSKTKALDSYIWNPAKLLNGFYLGFLYLIEFCIKLIF